MPLFVSLLVAFVASPFIAVLLAEAGGARRRRLP